MQAFLGAFLFYFSLYIYIYAHTYVNGHSGVWGTVTSQYSVEWSYQAEWHTCHLRHMLFFVFCVVGHSVQV